MKEFRTHCVEDTVNVGYTLGKFLRPGDIVGIVGDLGTGKTALTNGIAKALEIAGYITSPTFTIVNEYAAKIPMYHFDVYRVFDPDELFEIGFEEYINGNGIVVIEWADLIKDILPHQYVLIEIKKDLSKGIDERLITIDFKGDKYETFSKKMKEENDHESTCS